MVSHLKVFAILAAFLVGALSIAAMGFAEYGSKSAAVAFVVWFLLSVGVGMALGQYVRQWWEYSTSHPVEPEKGIRVQVWFEKPEPRNANRIRGYLHNVAGHLMRNSNVPEKTLEQLLWQPPEPKHVCNCAVVAASHPPGT